MSLSQKGAEVDKVKRRLIRAIARLLKEKKTEEEVWEELKKEHGGNCKRLWERMRSLTMKKLKRLLDADDRVENVPVIARMTLTDWLLYDLVIVHEKIDVIDRRQPKPSKVLDNLFSLVQLFSIEGRSGDDLAEAWTAATVYYNSKGHSCSPMLLQRRWYQIKELTRHVLYKFWYNYRGNQKLLITAKLEAPTDLQKAIALRYPEIVTQPFPEWEERIEKKLVIMPDEFEVKMRKKSLMKPSDENAPDVVLVEKKIDTITLADTDSEFSDEEESARVLQDTSINTNEDETSQTPIIVQVKTEPQDNIDIEEHSLYQLEEPVDRFQAEIERLEMEEEKIFTDNIDTVKDGAIQNEGSQMTPPLITDVKGAVVTRKEQALQDDVVMDDNEIKNIRDESHTTVEIDQEETTEKDVAMCEKELKCMESYCDEQSQESILIDDEDDDEEGILLKKESEDAGSIRTEHEDLDNRIISKEVNTKEEIDMTVVMEVENGNHTPATDMTVSDGTILNEFSPVISTILSGSQVKTKMEMDTEHMDKFADIEEIEDDVIQHTVQNPEEGPTNENDIQKIDTQESHDLDLVEDIVSNMNFADDGIEFADDGIEFEEDHNNQNELDDSHAVQEVENDGPPKFDLKLLMNPIVYTTKLDEMAVYKDVSLFDTIDEKELLDRIIIESKPIKPLPCTESINDEVMKVENADINEVDDDLFQNHSSDESECDAIDESKRIRLSSSFLQKPRSRSYNPIQLCKNPDFNTRLKRLTVGFFSSTRNRVLLKACKPMTIDLSKAFESKLVGGTIYLKPNDHVVGTVAEENITESSGSVLPSAVAVQSLMDTTDVDKILEEELKKRMLERNKTIKLPNISVVRQINQHLLMAEVAPIMAQIDKSALPGSANKIHENITIEKEKVTSMNNDTSNLKSNNFLLMPLDTCPININTNTSKMNNPISQNSTNVNEPYSVADSSKSKHDKAVDKSKKKPEKGKHLPSWITKISYPEPTAISDSLLTIDTLYKMLNALDPCKEFASMLNKPKKVVKHRKLKKSGETETSCLSGNSTTNDENKSLDKEIKENTCSNVKPKTGQNISHSKKRKRCCWARRRIENINGPHVGKGRHPCPQDSCTCCCIDLLRYKEMEVAKMCSNVQNDAKTNEEINLSQAIDTVIQQSCNNTSKVKDQPAVTIVNSLPSQSEDVNIGIQADLDECETYHIINNAPQHTQDEKNGTKATASEIPEHDGCTIELDEDEAINDTPSPVIRVYAGNYANTGNHSQSGKTVNRTRSKVTDKPPGNNVTTLQHILSTQEKPPDNMAKVINNPVKKQSLYKLYTKEPEIEPDVPCSCRPNVVVDRSSSTLLVDGSNDCLRHTKSRFSKETRIYLNRKTMSATERPFYVGKNKILLTNIKPPKPQSPPPDQQNPIQLPDGVQVVLLLDGTITYLVNPGVELTPDQLAAMPLILSTIMEHIKASGVSLPAPPHESKEIVNLDGEEANVKPNDNTDIKNPENGDANDTQSQDKSSVSDEHHSIAHLDATQSANEDFIKTVSVVDQLHLSTERLSEAGQNVSDDEQQTLSEKEAPSSEEVHPALDNSKTEKLPSSESVVNKNVEESTIKEQNGVSENLEKNGTVNSEIEKLPSSPEPAVTANVEENSRKEQNNVLENLEKNEAVNSEIEKLPSSPEPAVTANVKENTRKEQNNVSEDHEKIEGVTSTCSADSNDAAENTNSRNLLSDLMEMSGIVEEDVAPIPLEPSLSQAETVMQPSTLEIAESSVTQLGSMPVPGLSPLGSIKSTFTAQMDEKIHELNPITSFAELKYACDNNGLFFKLDLNCGSIVPINVCIQKTQAGSANSNMTLPTEVIDLTDDNGVSINKESRIKVTSTKTSKTLSGNELVKLMPRKIAPMRPAPPKLLKSRASLLNPIIAPPAAVLSTLLSQQTDNIILPRRNDTSKQSFATSSIEQKTKELRSRLLTKLKPLKMLQTKSANLNILRKNTLGIAAFKRNSILNKVQAKINLVDSDSPMEEEYLVDSSDDSSDDEPLAKKAKKMRDADDIGQIQNEDSVSDSATESASQTICVSQDMDNIDFEAAIDACAVPTTDVSPNEENIEPPPVPTQLVLAPSALSQPIVLNNSFLHSAVEDEDSQEDCILGV